MFVALEHGNRKEARYVLSSPCSIEVLIETFRFVKGTKHMGEPDSFAIILNWIYEMLNIKSHPGQQLKTIPFKAQY